MSGDFGTDLTPWWMLPICLWLQFAVFWRWIGILERRQIAARRAALDEWVKGLRREAR